MKPMQFHQQANFLIILQPSHKRFAYLSFMNLMTNLNL